MADTVLIAQYHIGEMHLSANGIRTDVSNIGTEAVRIGHMFNRVNTLIWDCLMVCGLKTFIVSHIQHYNALTQVEFHLILIFL